jgi:RNA polymerase sigma factor (TIGR02999 family)
MDDDEGLRDEVTGLLRSAESTGEDPVDRLMPLLYDDLRAIARRQLRRERPGQTLVTTALVHEAYLKLVDSSAVARRGRAYFFAAAARAMRQVLVDHARRRGRLKRQSDEDAAGDLALAVDDFSAELLDLHDALERFAAEHPRPARTVECRFFAGLSVEETAEALGVSPRTVKADWALARGWLFRELHGAAGR